MFCTAARITDNSCLVFLSWILILVLAPIVLILYIVITIFVKLYTILTCQLVCCNKLHNEFGDRFDTSAPHYDHKNGIFINYWDSFIKLSWYAILQIALFDLRHPKERSQDALEYETINWDKIYSFNFELAIDHDNV